MPNIVLPKWCESVRPHQMTAVQDICREFSGGNKVVFCEAPTGAGKTLIGELVRQELEARALYLCSSLSLQDQFMRDFPDAALLRGRSNYPTQRYPDRYQPLYPAGSLSTADCTKTKNDDDEYECNWCDPVANCPYELAKYAAIRSQLVCSNTYYFLYEANYVGAIRGRKLVIIDECDTLESIIMSFIEVSLSEKRLTQFGLPIPSKKTVESAWVEWAKECGYILDRLMEMERDGINFSSDLPAIRRAKALKQTRADIGRLLDANTGLESGGWVYTGYQMANTVQVIFRPVRISEFAKEVLWQHGDKFLLMSATIISAQEMANTLGLDL